MDIASPEVVNEPPLGVIDTHMGDVDTRMRQQGLLVLLLAPIGVSAVNHRSGVFSGPVPVGMQDHPRFAVIFPVVRIQFVPPASKGGVCKLVSSPEIGRPMSAECRTRTVIIIRILFGERSDVLEKSVRIINVDTGRKL